MATRLTALVATTPVALWSNNTTTTVSARVCRRAFVRLNQKYVFSFILTPSTPRSLTHSFTRSCAQVVLRAAIHAFALVGDSVSPQDCSTLMTVAMSLLVDNEKFANPLSSDVLRLCVVLCKTKYEENEIIINNNFFYVCFIVARNAALQALESASFGDGSDDPRRLRAS